MPNRCFNSVTINGPKEDIRKIRSYVKTKTYDVLNKEWEKFSKQEYKVFLNSFCPMPKVLESYYKCKTWKEYKVKRSYKWWWYEWRVSNRWCKWDVDPYICPTSSAKQLFFTFDSPRWPPLEAMAKLATLHPQSDIIHQYDEWGMWFSGEVNRINWELNYHEKYDDAYYGKGKECEECWWIYNGDNPYEWHDDDRTICMYCWKDLEANKKQYAIQNRDIKDQAS